MKYNINYKAVDSVRYTGHVAYELLKPEFQTTLKSVVGFYNRKFGSVEINIQSKNTSYINDVDILGCMVEVNMNTMKTAKLIHTGARIPFATDELKMLKSLGFITTPVHTNATGQAIDSTQTEDDRVKIDIVEHLTESDWYMDDVKLKRIQARRDGMLLRINLSKKTLEHGKFKFRTHQSAVLISHKPIPLDQLQFFDQLGFNLDKRFSENTGQGVEDWYE